MASETETRTGVPLAWRDDQRGYQCPYCSLYVALPKREWATCPRCPGIPVDETAGLLLEHAGFDEDDVQNALDALGVLLDALTRPHPTAHGTTEPQPEEGA